LGLISKVGGAREAHYLKDGREEVVYIVVVVLVKLTAKPLAIVST
jgi:hypothetical protein